jgi:drug/metabolite transporter (DMT)-like permease
VATCGFFAGLRYLPLAEASAITFTAPMIVVALSLPILGERPTRARIFARWSASRACSSSRGPARAALHPAIAFLLVTAVSNALYQLYTRRCARRTRTRCCSTRRSSARLRRRRRCRSRWRRPLITWHDVGLLLLAGFFAGLGHGAMIGAYSRAPASLLAPFTYLQIVWATAFGLVIFGQHPDGHLRARDGGRGRERRRPGAVGAAARTARVRRCARISLANTTGFGPGSPT